MPEMDRGQWVWYRLWYMGGPWFPWDDDGAVIYPAGFLMVPWSIEVEEDTLVWRHYDDSRYPGEIPEIPRPSLRERSEEHTSELQSQSNLVCRLLLEKKKKTKQQTTLL